MAVLAVDIGTGSVRTVAFDLSGAVLASAKVPVGLQVPQPGWAEQNPDEIVAATVGSLRSVRDQLGATAEIEGVGFSSQLYSLMPIDRSGRPLANSIVWTDRRAQGVADELRQRADAPNIVASTGCPLQPIYPLSKLIWLRRHADPGPDARFVSIKDYVLSRLTGRLVTDTATASATGLLDLAVLDWSDAVLDLAGIRREQLPDLRQPTDLLTNTAPVASGLEIDVPLVLGAGDAQLSSIGAGATDRSTLAINIGTSAAARRTVSELSVDGSGRLWTYACPGERWVLGGMIGSAGQAFDRVLDLVLDGRSASAYEEAAALIEHTDPGSDGLTMLPFYAGEMSPGWRASARGAIVGLDLRHERGHVLRAAIEGIVFALRSVRTVIDEVSGADLQEIALTGGVISEPVVQQIIADAFDLPVVVSTDHEGSARGAAAIARLALGLVDDLAASFHDPSVPVQRREPDDAATDRYTVAYERFVAATDRLDLPHPGKDNT